MAQSTDGCASNTTSDQRLHTPKTLIISALPPNLLQAISPPNSGRVVLVLGAGCSAEDPTGLPLAGDLSAECCRRLVADGILAKGEVDDHRDLSAVAEAVYKKTGGQHELVNRFPPAAFRQAEPNEGYLILAALLVEGVLADTLTLNFDLTARTALATLGTKARVSTVRGPEEHEQLGARNLIYLHRDIDCNPDEIILRAAHLEEEWQEHWEEVIAQRVLASPITVFVGLGSPASVLVETTRRIIAARGTPSPSVYVVDPSPHDDSRFADALGIAPAEYFRMGWGDFMRALAQRVVEEHRASVERDCSALSTAVGTEVEDVGDLSSRLAEIGLLGLGKLRAAWMLCSGSYLPFEEGASLRHFCELVLAVRMVERISNRQARFSEDGLVGFHMDGYVTQVIVCSGCGWRTGALVETELSKRRETMRRKGQVPLVALVASVESSPEVATPPNIAADSDPDDLISGPVQIRIVSIASLRNDPGLVREVFT